MAGGGTPCLGSPAVPARVVDIILEIQSIKKSRNSSQVAADLRALNIFTTYQFYCFL